jgi:hypothetical protein
MGAVISATVFTLKDELGVRRTEGIFLWEFQEGYVAGGIEVNLSAYFRRLESMSAEPSSGAGIEQVVPNQADIPNTTAASVRLQIVRQGGSGVALSEIVSGIAVSGTRARLRVLGY